MNLLPIWATHVAVDADGGIWAFEGEPTWDAQYGLWGPHNLRCQLIQDLPPSVAGRLCVAVKVPESAS